MAIGSAIERGSLICVFDEHGITLFSKAKGSGPNDGLLGFTGSTVTVRFGRSSHLRRKGHDAILQGGVTGSMIPAAWRGHGRRYCLRRDEIARRAGQTVQRPPRAVVAGSRRSGPPLAGTPRKVPRLSPVPLPAP